MAEQLFRKQQVAGSIPITGSSFLLHPSGPKLPERVHREMYLALLDPFERNVRQSNRNIP